jgi:hypothetical protein
VAPPAVLHSGKVEEEELAMGVEEVVDNKLAVELGLISEIESTGSAGSAVLECFEWFEETLQKEEEEVARSLVQDVVETYSDFHSNFCIDLSFVFDSYFDFGLYSVFCFCYVYDFCFVLNSCFCFYSCFSDNKTNVYNLQRMLKKKKIHR